MKMRTRLGRFPAKREMSVLHQKCKAVPLVLIPLPKQVYGVGLPTRKGDFSTRQINRLWRDGAFKVLK